MITPTPPLLDRLRLRARWARRRLGYCLARQLRRLERHLDPLPRTLDRARASVVADDPPSIASGRADLQLVHGEHRPTDPDLY